MRTDRRSDTLGAIVRMMIRSSLTLEDVAAQLARPNAAERDTNRNLIKALVARPGGISVREMIAAGCGDTPNACGHSIIVIERQGLAYRGKRAGEKLRWFGTVAEAREWVALPKTGNGTFTTTRKERPAPVPRVNAAPAAKAAKVLTKPAGPAALTSYQAPVAVKVKKPVGEPDMSRAKVIVCPSARHDARYQVEPGTRVMGGFATAGIGRYEVSA